MTDNTNRVALPLPVELATVSPLDWRDADRLYQHTLNTWLVDLQRGPLPDLIPPDQNQEQILLQQLMNPS